ncbi:hypothetical protein BC829DRAFT_25391 [Chytridium lagenaria]|nr:hypothetical protein BC829DRAFT_25391 [Chytridium lagenaria]
MWCLWGYKTPLWRTGPSGHRTLCNACGMRWAKGKLVISVASKDAVASPTAEAVEGVDSEMVRAKEEIVEESIRNSGVMEGRAGDEDVVMGDGADGGDAAGKAGEVVLESDGDQHREEMGQDGVEDLAENENGEERAEGGDDEKMDGDEGCDEELLKEGHVEGDDERVFGEEMPVEGDEEDAGGEEEHYEGDEEEEEVLKEMKSILQGMTTRTTSKGMKRAF